MLTLSNVSVGYNGINVIKNVNMHVNYNENLSIIGPNGCGKTTLLKAVANILPYSGEIEIAGTSIKKMKHKEISLRIAMLTQMSGIYFSYTVFDTVMMGRYLHIKDKLLGLPSEADKEAVLTCLDAVDLLEQKDRMITTLSGGQLQRVFLARTLVQEPEVILLDEPTNHLDLKYQIELVEYLKKWASEGSRVVVGVMHDINLAMRLSDDILVLKDGEIQVQGKADEVITDSLLEYVYDIDVAEYMRESLQRWQCIGENNKNLSVPSAI
ncbi:MAG: ABC transporter ATP-binding protein [Oscillospiraceae bacterium]|nr:ABC transporter ATP-binding protein [Oscillospiraceae bacterium]